MPHKAAFSTDDHRPAGRIESVEGSRPLVRITGLTKRYPAVVAVHGGALAVPTGTIYGLLGPNGAGKTTLLECLLGLRTPDEGEIWIGDINARTDPVAARRLVGAQLQAATMQDTITPREALSLFASFYPRGADSGELLARFGLDEKADARFATLSGGQRQRLFLALALAGNPSVLILDEPTVGLDPTAKRELHGLILQARGECRTVLLSTHDLEEAHGLCDKVAIMDQGRIVADDSPSALVAAAEQSKPPGMTRPTTLEDAFFHFTGRPWGNALAFEPTQ